MSKLKPYMGLIIFVLSLVVLALIFQSIGISRIEEWVLESGSLGPVIFIAIHTISIIIAPFEGSVLMLSAGIIFGFWPGVIYTGIAGFLGSSFNFWIARKIGHKLILKLIGKNGEQKLTKISKKINQNPLWLYPLMATALFDLVGYAAGLSKVKYLRFLTAVLLSTIINVPIYVGIGMGVIEGEVGLRTIFVVVITIILILIISNSVRKKFLQ